MDSTVTASLVLYNNPESQVEKLLSCFKNACEKGMIYLIDNSPSDRLRVFENYENVTYIYLNKNIGFGAGHNIAINKISGVSDYHLVLNPDIEFGDNTINRAIDFMDINKDVGLLSPKLVYPDGRQQLMCRLLPTPFDLIIRRFIPKKLKFIFKRRIENYLMNGLDMTKINVIPNLPGSFMFLRNSSLQEIGGFDEKFFMYLEDIDLTRRIGKNSKTVYYPEVIVVHDLAQGSYKSLKLLFVHIKSAIYYFNKWGWFKDKQRENVNASLIKLLLIHK